MFEELITSFRDHNPVVYCLAGFLAVGVVIVFERTFVLQFVYRLKFHEFTKSLKKMVSAGDFDRAKKYCAASGTSGIPNICMRAIDTYEKDSSKVRSFTEEELEYFVPLIHRRLAQLPALTTVCILLGALGSLNGIWKSFQYIDVLDTSLKSSAFADSLGATLAPISMAIMASVLLMFPYGLLTSCAERIETESRICTNAILGLLANETHQQGTQYSNQSQLSTIGSLSDAENPEGNQPSIGPIKGNQNDKTQMERSGPTPDEEEII